jgi:molybdenum cofactor guanylyltransferase
MQLDKGSLVYHDVPQREFLFRTLKECCAAVYTSCFPAQNIPSSLNPLEDQFNIRGPMNGILSAFQKHPDKAWLVVAVDMPNVTAAVLKQLVGGRNRNKVATCFLNEAHQFPEPLLTIWEPKAFPLLLKYFQEGRVSPRDFLAVHDVHLLRPDNPDSLLNINDPKGYEKFRNRKK